MKPNPSKMEYRYLGNSGLKVSVVGFGNWVNNEEEQLTIESIKLCLENGINYFDTAEAYGMGNAETLLGKAFKALNIQREKIVVSTKILRIDQDPNDIGETRKHIIEGIKNSLKRLQLDYVDIIFAHAYDKYTPIEETCRAMNWVIDKGLAFYWGTSKWSASQIMEAFGICEMNKLIPPVVEQCQYSMLYREVVDSNYSDLFKRYKLGTTIWSPLFGGILSGKYINEIPKDSRVVTHQRQAAFHYGQYEKNKKEWNEKLIKLKEVAEKKLNCNLAQLAISWVIANPDVSTCILACSKTQQLEETIKAVEIYKKMDKDILKEIENILDNAPEGERSFRDWEVLPIRRNLFLGVDYKKGK